MTKKIQPFDNEYYLIPGFGIKNSRMYLKINRLASLKLKYFSTRKVFIEVYGCQMNKNDAEVVHGILKDFSEVKYEKCNSLSEADIVLLMTCAIRENAETKIWNRLDFIRSFSRTTKKPLTVGVLGCMAERLKSDLLERSKTVDLVCGPDAYRDLPNLLKGDLDRENSINVSLSADETYADVAPVRLDSNKKVAFVSIMRGCNNMCAFCIVPFVRGRERSRPLDSVTDEVRRLVDQGIQEITLLGQNVNSYCDDTSINCLSNGPDTLNNAVLGFSSVFKKRRNGYQFVDLLDKVSEIAPNIRFRFTSPHPKDFPEPLLNLIKSKPNICKQIHLPAQSGSNSVLETMRRGYTREAYLNLVFRIREIIPEVTLSSDFISGFIGETDEDHKSTLELIKTVGFDMAYMYAYSMREKTMAHRRYTDTISDEIKQSRLREVIDTFYSTLNILTPRFVGTKQLVLIEGPSKKDNTRFQGRTDGNKTVVMDSEYNCLNIGDFLEVDITGKLNSTLIGKYIKKSSIKEFNQS